MDDKFLFGVIVGMLGGAVIATKSQKARQLVKSSEEQLKNKVAELSNDQKKKS